MYVLFFVETPACGGDRIFGSKGFDGLGARAQDEVEVEVEDREGVAKDREYAWPSEKVGDRGLLPSAVPARGPEDIVNGV
jgi:hypothetical protein